MTEEIVERHRRGEMKNGVPNPSLEAICRLVAKAAASITPNVQRRAFQHTGLTLATDGSEDSQLSRSLTELLQTHHQDPIPRPHDLPRFLSLVEIRFEQPSIKNIFKNLCADASKAKEELFNVIPVVHKMKTNLKLVCQLDMFSAWIQRLAISNCHQSQCNFSL